MQKSIVLGLVLSLPACHGHGATQLPPAPREYATSLRPVSVVNAVRSELVAQDFQITKSDARRGYIYAKRTRRGSANSRFIECKYGLGAEGGGNVATQSLITDLSVYVSAIPHQRDAIPGSDVRISAAVVTRFVDTPANVRPATNGDCISSGAIEARLVELLNR